MAQIVCIFISTSSDTPNEADPNYYFYNMLNADIHSQQMPKFQYMGYKIKYTKY